VQNGGNVAEIASAYVALIPSLKGAGKTISKELDGPEVRRAADDAGKKAGSRMGSGLKAGIGAALAGVSVGAIVSIANSAVESFSQLEDSTAAAGVVFGDAMGSIIKQSKTASTQLGMSQQQVINAANTFGTYGKAAGLSGEELAKFATRQTQLAADMASFKGTSPEQAIEAIGAALRGEMEPIRTYGVLLDDATLRNEALAMGLIKTTKDALTPQQKTLAAQSAILKQTTDATGDFARTSESTANVQKTLQANTENLRAEIGEKLAPAFTAVREKANEFLNRISGGITWIEETGIPALKDFGKWIQDNGSWLSAIALTVGGVTAALVVYRTVLGLVTLATTIATVANKGLNAVLNANPAVRIITLIGLLVGAIVWLYNNNETARKIIDGTWKGIKTAISAVADWWTGTAWPNIKKAIDWMKSAFISLRDSVGTAWADLQKMVASPVNFIIGTVYNNGIRKMWNIIAEKLGLSMTLPLVPTLTWGARTGGGSKGGKGAATAMATGGVLPGYTPGRDVHEFYSPTAGRLLLSGGEAIMRPEWTRAVGGPAAVAAMNAAARQGRAFAGGGVVDFLGDAADWVRQQAGAIGRIFTDPAGALGDLLMRPANALMERMGGGAFGQMLAALPRKAISGVIEWVKGNLGGSIGGPMGSANAMGIPAMTALVRGLDPSARVTSGYRPGARTATGFMSLHSLRRAIDVVSSNMGATFKRLIGAVGKTAAELYYTGPGGTPGRGLRRGNWVNLAGITDRTHRNHIHLGMRNGGVLPRLYDQGGWMPSGGVGVNLSGKPEAVLTPDESNALKAGLGGPLVGTLIVQDEHAAIDELERLRRRAMTQARIGVRR
jgi:hypothetical protein